VIRDRANLTQIYAPTQKSCFVHVPYVITWDGGVALQFITGQPQMGAAIEAIAFPALLRHNSTGVGAFSER